MGRTRKYKYFSCDFETTVFEGQTSTEVWASAIVELNTEDVKIFHSIDETYQYLKSLKCNCVCYYHNLKFDGNFWLYYLIHDLKLKQAYEQVGKNETDIAWNHQRDMANGSFMYMISDMGMWYTIKIKVNNYLIEIRDSLKLLPFSVEEIGKAFQTKHKKLSMEYKGFRYSGCLITEEEKHYIANDVLVVKEALEIMFSQGHNKLTIGSCCLSEYKMLLGKSEYNRLFPDLSIIGLNQEKYGSSNVDEYIRKSYKGGWCYLVKGKENKIYQNGITADVNSLYPSMMSSESGNLFPIGLPTFWSGNYIPNEALGKYKYYFIRIRTRFYIKKNYLPFIQIKGNIRYKATECLETSDIYNAKTKTYNKHYISFDGEIKDTRVTLTLTCTDYALFREHYGVEDFEILDGCYFSSALGIFDDYIDKYKKLKLESKGALRTLAKLFLNNLYGKMASSNNSSFKIAYLKDDDTLGFISIVERDKDVGYIPVGSAITSYARNFTIRTAQKNYNGVENKGFIYADTDSIHCDLSPEQLKGVPVHDKNFCCWKLESSWDNAIFVRQKTYIEHITQEDLTDVKPYYSIKCAGMPNRCKQLFEWSMTEKPENETLNSVEEEEFLSRKRTMKDFAIGLKIPSKLLPKRIKGGILLVDTFYELRGIKA